MTVASQVNKVVYSGNGSNTNFPITFNYLNNINNVGVYLTNASGVVTKLINTQFTYVEAETKITYPVEFGTALQTGETLTLIREVPALQEMDLLNQGPFIPETIESLFDKLTMLAQDANEKLNRCIIYPIDQNPTSAETNSFLTEITTLKNQTIDASNTAATYSNTAFDMATIASDQATNAAVSAAAALVSKNAADASATAAANSASAAAASALTAQNPVNVNQDSTHRFVTDTQISSWDAEKTKFDTYSNLVTWATTASNGLRAFATDLKLYYIVIDNILNEVNFLRTISGTITQTQKSVGTTAVRATVSGSAPSATRKRLILMPDPTNSGNIYLGGSGVTTANGKQIIGPDSLMIDWDASDYYLISDASSQKVHIIEVV